MSSEEEMQATDVGTRVARGEATASRELDALVAEKVMGWGWQMSPTTGKRWFTDPENRGDVGFAQPADGTEPKEDPWWMESVRRFGDCPVVPHFSTDIAAAWTVVERMREIMPPRLQNLSLVAYAYNRTYANFDPDADEWVEANGEHATPHAICLAALEALDVYPPVPASPNANPHEHA